MKKVKVGNHYLFDVNCECEIKSSLSAHYFGESREDAYQIAINYQKILIDNYDEINQGLTTDLEDANYKVLKLGKSELFFNSLTYSVKKQFKDIISFIKKEDYNSAIKEAEEAIKHIEKEWKS